MLGSQGSGMRRLVTPGTWAPEILLDDLTEAYADPRYGLDGVHIYTFNALEQTARWWDEHSDRRWHSGRSEEHTSELQSRGHLVCRLLLEKKKDQAVNRVGD